MAAARRGVLYFRAMRFEHSSAAIETGPASASEPRPYEAPGYEVINLACEISAYAPDGDGPLF